MSFVLLLFLISLLPVVEQAQLKVIHAHVGDDVILQCHLERPFDMKTITIEWKFQGKEIHVHRSGSKDDVNSDPKYKGRTSLFRDELKNGNISLKLTNITKKDEGNYTCFVPKLESQVRNGNVALKVDESGPKGNRTKGWEIVGISILCYIVIFIFIAGRRCWRRKRNQRDPDGGGGQGKTPEPPGKLIMSWFHDMINVMWKKDRL